MNTKKKIASVLLISVLISYFFSFYINTSAEVRQVSSDMTRKVYPVGRLIGLKLYTNGVLVVGMSEIDGKDGKKYKPYENTGIKEGDMIRSINGNEIQNTTQLMSIINASNGNDISIKYQRDNDEIYTTMKPIEVQDGSYMIGIWVRDAAAGLGTLTYYDEANGSFAALGHGIQDVDTDKLLNISNGEIVTSQIVSIVKGLPRRVGEIRGIIDNGKKIGEISKNTELGVYGKVTNTEFLNDIKLEEVPVATRNQIEIGKAKIYCELKNDEVKEYEIEIKKIYKNNSSDNKSMLIKVTDKDLIEKTGGIIPGMSGTPIVQNGKFIGAITSVVLNDPTQGYAIFADMMIKN